jgi:hypothetical protein
MNHPKSELAWILADYQAAGREAPARIKDNPELTEGQAMSAEEVDEFIKDSIATLRILADKHSHRYQELAATYRADLKYLNQVGNLAEDEYLDLTDESQLHF